MLKFIYHPLKLQSILIVCFVSIFSFVFFLEVFVKPNAN